MVKFGREGNKAERGRRRYRLAVREQDVTRENGLGADDEVAAATKNRCDHGITLFSTSTKRHKGCRTVDALPQEHEEEGGQTTATGRNGNTEPVNYDAGMPNTSFRMLGLSQWICANVAALGIMMPTAVQQGCIPPILQGRDIIGTAQTGTGKTAAFALSLIHI